MRRTEPLLNFRVSDETKAALDDVLSEDWHGRTRSEFIREAVEAAIRQERAERVRARRKLGFMLAPKDCVHPPQAQRQLPFYKECTICGTEIRKVS